jgi:hypothetical protein
VEARPLLVSLVGNGYVQGSDDGVTFSDTLAVTNTHIRFSTDGGTTWVVLEISSSGTDHPALSIGVPDNGLSVDATNQILTLSLATTSVAGAMSATDKTKLDALKYDELANVGSGATIYKNAATVSETTTHNLKSLVAGTNVTLTEGTDSIQIDFGGTGTGESNTASNQGAGIGIFDNKNGIDLEFRSLVSANSILGISLDAGNKEVDFTIDETAIDHDNLTNFVANEHIDHSSVSITTTEGITGGGDLTSTRNLTLEFDGLTAKSDVQDTDQFAFYRNSAGEDSHFQITYSNFKGETKIYYDTIYVPLTTSVNAGLGLSGGGSLATDQTLYLDINSMPTITFDPAADYLAFYDASAMTHGKALLSTVIGTVSSVSAGDGMDFTTITSTGDVTLGIPTTLTKTTTNSVSTTSHQHIVDLSTFLLTDLGDIGAPTASYYLRRNAGDTAYEWADPAIGANVPGGPNTSIQFNNSSSFDGNAGLLYDYTTDSIYFTDSNASAGATLYLGADTTEQYIQSLNNAFLISNFDTSSEYIHLKSNRLLLGDTLPEGDYFMGIVDPNTSQFDYVIRTRTILGLDLMNLKSSGDFYLPSLSSASTTDVLYYDSSTGLITYGSSPTGGAGIQTLTAGSSTSGMTVNGGNTSSASSIEIAQNDLNLPIATPVVGDYLGFYDVSGGLQSRVTFGDLPGWDIRVDSVTQEAIQLGDSVNFVAGTNTSLSYDAPTNSLTINSQVTAVSYEDIAFEFADLDGTAQTYTLDIKASFNYNIVNTILETDDSISGTVTGGATTITFSSVGTITENTTVSAVSSGSRIYLNITAGHSGTTIRGKLVIQRT